MRTYPYRLRLTAEDRKAVARWRRNVWIGYAAVAAILVLGGIVFASDPEDRSNQEATIKVDHFGIDELLQVLVPEITTAPGNPVVGPTKSGPPQNAEQGVERGAQLGQAAASDAKPR